MKQKRDKMIAGGNKRPSVIEIESSGEKPGRNPVKARKSTRGTSDISIKLDGERYEESPTGDLVLSPPRVGELIPASKIMGTGFSFRDNLRRKLVDILIDKVKNPYLCLRSSQTKREVLVDLALRIEN